MRIGRKEGPTEVVLSKARQMWLADDMRTKRMGCKILFLLLIITLVGGLLVGCSTKTSLTNAGFEEGGTGKITGWKRYNYQASANDDQARTSFRIAGGGQKGNCLVIQSGDTNDARVYQTVDVKKNSYYRVSVSVRTENVEGGSGANISALNCMQYSDCVTGTSDGWQNLEAYFSTGKQSSFDLCLCLGGYGNESKGTAYFDNLAIEKLSALPEGVQAIALQSKAEASADPSLKTPLVFQLLFATLLIGLLVYAVVVAMRTDRQRSRAGLSLSEPRVRLSKPDYIILLILTVVCAVMSFANLGDTKAASQHWKGVAGDFVIVEFEEAKDVRKIAYSNGIPKSDGVTYYSVSYETEDGSYQDAASIQSAAFYEWQMQTTSFTAKRVKVTATLSGLPLNELGFFTLDEQGELQQIPVTVVEISAATESAEGPACLFDEQDTVPTVPSYQNGTYFDEIYFPRTAYEHINGLSVYETTHPPLGKLLISVGIRIFGMNPFGWRFMGTLFGVMMVPFMYLFGLKLFQKRSYAFLTGFLMMFDFMRLAQTRLATIDSYSAFFVIGMYYFMYDYFTQKSYDLRFRRSLVPLFFCGLMFGLGAAAKWTSLYAGAGIAFLFFLAKYLEADDYASGRGVSKEGLKPWTLRNFLPTCLICVLFFIIIPGTIYVLSYIPYMAANPDLSLLEIVIENQKDMYNYHSGLNATHAYSSHWYQWPIIYRPIWYYKGTVEAGSWATIVSLGNPAIWFPGLIAVFGTVYFTWKRRDKKMIVPLVAYGLQYFPWILVTRCAFIYHYFTAVPFLIMMLVYCIQCLREDQVIGKKTVIVYMALVLLLFVLFYPMLTGMTVSQSYVESFRWFSSWYF